MGELNTTTLISQTVQLNSTANILVSASNITAQVELILQAGADATLNAGTLINIESLTADVQGALDLGNNLLLNVTNGIDLLVNELVLGDGAVIRSVTGDIVANGVNIVADEFAEIQSNIDSINVNDTLNSIDISGVQGVIVEADRVLRGDLINIITSEGEVLLNDGVSLDAVESIVLESVQDLNLADAVELISQAVELRSADNLVI